MLARNHLNWRLFPLLLVLLTLAGCDDGNDLRPERGITIANLNVLHGFDCDSAETDTGQCRVAARIALLSEHLVAAGCPDLVTLQEIVNADFAPTALGQPLQSIVKLIEEEIPPLAAACGFRYQLLYQPLRAVTIAEADEELVLSRYRVTHWQTRNLFGPLYNEEAGVLVFARHVLHARVDHPGGEVDVYTTHLASGSDLASSTCGEQFCPAECDSADTVRVCQTEQLTRFVNQTRRPENLALITGDFNAVPGSTEYQKLLAQGWLDSQLASGAGECDATTAINCTSGRGSSLADIESPAANVSRRIDYIFVALPQHERRCDIVSAGPFAAQANPYEQSCGSAPLAPCWVSDHSGNQARLECVR